MDERSMVLDLSPGKLLSTAFRQFVAQSFSSLSYFFANITVLNDIKKTDLNRVCCLAAGIKLYDDVQMSLMKLIFYNVAASVS